MSKEKITYDNAVNFLIKNVPELKLLLNEHSDSFGEVLPHVFFGNLTRYLADQISLSRSENQKSWETVEKTIISLEQLSTSIDQDLKELIQVSFLENIETNDLKHQTLAAMLGPNLKQELAKLRKAQGY